MNIQMATENSNNQLVTENLEQLNGNRKSLTTIWYQKALNNQMETEIFEQPNWDRNC